MKKKDRDYIIFLEDIFESAGRIEKYTKGFTKANLSKNQETQDAVIRRFEIIGEAVKNLPAGFKNNHKEIDWRKIAGMRNVLIHEYFGIHINRIWKTVKEDIPDLKSKISKILEESKKQILF